MTICAVKEVSSGCIEISTSEGPSFFIRTSYLSLINPDELLNLASYSLSQVENTRELTTEESNDITRAASAFMAEKAAMKSLIRSEQSRFLLFQKLIQKGYDKNIINMALDYLESVNFLNDERYAAAWLRSHLITKSEGKTKLSYALSAHGIKQNTIKKVLDEYFNENDETELCRKAYEKLKRHNTAQDKVFGKLIQSGFSVKIIRTIISEYTEHQ